MGEKRIEEKRGRRGDEGKSHNDKTSKQRLNSGGFKENSLMTLRNEISKAEGTTTVSLV